MKITTNTLHIITIALWLTLCSAIPAMAVQSGCRQAADRWILQLNDPKNTELFQRYADNNCQFSGKWVKRSEDNTSKPQRERMCQDLVLLWSYKNCIYFRDVINPEAYEPCKAWSREMHQHCMDNDVQWFP
ncbi:hypothetical protein SAMN05660420_00840 [Desulfuromusa kysingii]|uniref:Uncharacterized protein n=1 Tax=Desulfuromusa kysingii TaxID=37625 RepID=A0A1H3X7A0_9BACT|nr:hypothetical protein [Desulfuromusa kysingii]SDZ94821.1 hypothetical protein SAMN05660420_00840 [Desulfuromusa kysingii]